MTYPEVKTLLETTGLPVVYYQWPDGHAPDPPYIVFCFPGDNDFIGDNSNYQKIRELTVELYTDCKDFALEETVDERELGRAINGFLRSVSAENRTLFLRRYWFGDAVRDAAQRVGISENAASKRLHRIKLRLRDYLEREGYFHE